VVFGAKFLNNLSDLNDRDGVISMSRGKGSSIHYREFAELTSNILM